MRLWLSISLLSATLISAAPALERSSFLRRQNATFSGPTTLTTVTTTETAVGTIIQTCQVRLTPVVTNNGQGAVREDKLCKFEVRGNGNGGGNNNNNNNGNINFTSTLTETTTTTTTTSLQSTSTSAAPPTTIAPPLQTGQGQVAAPSGVAVLGTNPPAAALPTPTPTIIGPNPPANAANAPAGITVLGQSSIAAAADLAGTTVAAAAQESATEAGFVIPGKKLQVLPIGLGVFAGISVIALIVVGLVTYERTKYRKTFRQRKLAESAAPMGYGGMAER